MDAGKPPVLRTQPPVQTRATNPTTYPQVFVNARWRLGSIGAVGIVGILASTAILSVPSSGTAGVFAVFASFFCIFIFYALLQLRAKWTLYEDRLEYRNFLGIQKTIRRLDVLSFAPDWTGIRWMLRDAHSGIPVGWEVGRWQDLRITLQSWAPRPW